MANLVSEMVRCETCGFHKIANEDCNMCFLLEEGE